jgi:hypothetical protein
MVVGGRLSDPERDPERDLYIILIKIAHYVTEPKFNYKISYILIILYIAIVLRYSALVLEIWL